VSLHWCHGALLRHPQWFTASDCGCHVSGRTGGTARHSRNSIRCVTLTTITDSSPAPGVGG